MKKVTTVKIDPTKYFRATDNSKCVEAGNRVLHGELKWSHYAIENDKGVHYYLILK